MTLSPYKISLAPIAIEQHRYKLIMVQILQISSHNLSIHFSPLQALQPHKCGCCGL